MTRVRYEIWEDEFILECKGHAGYADAGNDIVCAGISTLVQTLTSYLPEITDKEEIKISSGEVFCMAKGAEALTCFKMILAGLRMLESSYPQYLQITEGCTIKSENPLQ